ALSAVGPGALGSGQDGFHLGRVGAGVGGDGHLLDGDGSLLGGAVGVGTVLILHRVRGGHGVHHLHALVDLAVDGVGVVQIGQPARGGVGGHLAFGVAVGGQLCLHGLVHAVRQGGDNVKLALPAVGVALGGGGAQSAGVVAQAAVRLQRDGIVGVDGGPAAAGAAGVAPLHRKALLHPPDDGAVIVAAAGKPHKVIHRHGGGVGVQNRPHLPQRGGKNGDQVALRRGGELALGARDGGAVRRPAAGGQRRGQAQRQHQRTESFLEGRRHGGPPFRRQRPANARWGKPRRDGKSVRESLGTIRGIFLRCIRNISNGQAQNYRKGSKMPGRAGNALASDGGGSSELLYHIAGKIDTA